MPLSKKDKGQSSFSKFKGVFSKGRTAAEDKKDDQIPQEQQWSQQYQQTTQHSNGNTPVMRKPISSPLSPSHPAYRPPPQQPHFMPGPQNNTWTNRVPSPGPFQRNDYYVQQETPRDQRPAYYVPEQQSYQRQYQAPQPTHMMPYQPNQHVERFDPDAWREANDHRPFLGSSLEAPRQIIRPSSAQGNTAPPPQFVIVEAPDDGRRGYDSDEDNQLVVLVPTNDGRYLPVNIGREANFRVPSPSILVAGRPEQREIVYLDSDSNESSDSLYRPAPPTDRRLEYDVRHENLRPRFMPQEDWSDDDEPVDFKLPGISTPGATTPGGPGGPNLNRRYDYLPESMVPRWYDKHPPVEEEESPNYLCSTCSHIDLLELFKQPETDVMPKPREYIVLGPLRSIIDKANCGLCSLVTAILVLDVVADLPRFTPEAERKEIQKAKLVELMDEVYYLCPIRFKTTYRTPKLYIFSGKEITEASKKSSALRPRRTMAIRPLHRDGPNLGRLLKNPDQIDFAWIRERMLMCDERDEGKLDYVHGVNVRAIDVQRMCLVDLDHRARYVTLSYTWGRVNQLQLKTENEHLFRSPGGLQRQWNAIPKTIQDSIKLVREIGERYIWIDALCIIQDDEHDKQQQIAEMGSIYRNSILTVCACCGDDANYGLPGIDPDSRTTRQVVRVVGELLIGNALPDAETIEGAKWDTRGWTLQEKVLSQRKLQISDECAQWWCWHTISSEDENCRHCWWDPGTDHRSMFFFKSEHDLVVSKIGRNSNLDTYAFIVADYTARDLTFEKDAEVAVKGALTAIEGLFRGEFVAGLPDTELGAALLWVPLGKSRRRVDANGQPLFPSWSWLGWVGQVSYPWMIERNLPMSENGTTLQFKNASENATAEDRWFDGDTYRCPLYPPNFLEQRRGQRHRWAIDDDDGWTWVDQFDTGPRWMHPVAQSPRNNFKFFHGPMRQLRFRTLSAHFKVEASVHCRKENFDYQHKLYYSRVLNPRGFCVGYIHTANDSNFDSVSDWEFIVLSRASTNSDPTIGSELLYSTPIEELHSVYSMAYMLGAMERMQPTAGGGEDGGGLEADTDELAYFDTRLYDATTPWGLFNVLMIRTMNGIASRAAVGRIQVAAFMEAQPVHKDIILE